MSDLGEDPVDLLIVSHQGMTRDLMEVQLRHRFSVETQGSGAEALAFLGCQPVQLVIVEYRMPEMDGLEFIRQARAVQAHAIYVLLVEEVDFDAAVKAKLDLVADHFVKRPWDAHQLCESLVMARSALIAKRGQ